MDYYPVAFPSRRDYKFFSIRTNWVISIRDIWGVRIIGKFVGMVQINWNTIAINLPVGRYRNFIPPGIIKISFIEIHWAVSRVSYPIELPVSILSLLPI